MRKIFEKIRPFQIVGDSYSFALSNSLTILRLCFVYILFHMLIGLGLDGFFESQSLYKEWGLWLGSTIIKGWIVFSLTRAIYMDETLRTISAQDMFSIWRINAMIKTVCVFTIFMAVSAICGHFFMDYVDQPASSRPGIWYPILLLYCFIMIGLSAYISVAPAVRARSMTFFYMIFHPTYLFKVLVLALFLYAPIYIAALTHMAISYPDIEALTTALAEFRDQSIFLDYLLVGAIEIIAFVLFSIGLIYTTKFYIVPESAFMMRKFQSKQDKPQAEQGKEKRGDEGAGAQQDEAAPQDDQEKGRQEILEPEKKNSN